MNTRVDRLLGHTHSLQFGILLMDTTNSETITSLWFATMDERDGLFQALSYFCLNNQTSNDKQKWYQYGRLKELVRHVVRNLTINHPFSSTYIEYTSVHLLRHLDLAGKARTTHNDQNNMETYRSFFSIGTFSMKYCSSSSGWGSRADSSLEGMTWQ